MDLGKAIVNGRGELGLDPQAQKFINQEVTILKKIRVGLYEVQLASGETCRVRTKNLTFIQGAKT